MKYFITKGDAKNDEDYVQVIIVDKACACSLLVFHSGHTRRTHITGFSEDHKTQRVSMIQAMLRVGELTNIEDYYRKEIRDFISQGERNETIRNFHDAKRVFREYPEVDLSEGSILMFPTIIDNMLSHNGEKDFPPHLMSREEKTAKAKEINDSYVITGTGRLNPYVPYYN